MLLIDAVLQLMGKRGSCYRAIMVPPLDINSIINEPPNKYSKQQPFLVLLSNQNFITANRLQSTYLILAVMDSGGAWIKGVQIREVPLYRIFQCKHCIAIFAKIIWPMQYQRFGKVVSTKVVTMQEMAAKSLM